MARADQVIPYGRQWLDEDDIAAVVAVLRGDWLTQGPHVAQFESALAELCGARYAVATSSGTAALHIAALASGIGPGDTAITSPISFVASANCIAYCGARPHFADVDPASITLDIDSLADACERYRPRLIVPVDFAGQPADLPAIHDVARRHHAMVIEDAAHALGASYQHEGREYRAGCCAHSDMAIFSFHPVKHVTTGEGGAVVTNDRALYQRLCDLRTHGITRDPARLTRQDGPWYYEQHLLGYNYRITDFQCALGTAQLRKLPEFVARRRAIVDQYAELLRDVSDRLALLLEGPGRYSSYHLMVARLAEGAPGRRRMFDRLHERGIRAQVHYSPIHLQPWYRAQFDYAPGDFPHAERYYEGCLSLPLYPAMTDADVSRVCAAVHESLADSS
jgi:UDP-4-amino-4,6-dideoxy-N-acetyl-beta-L-altrosamine transaminase